MSSRTSCTILRATRRRASRCRSSSSRRERLVSASRPPLPSRKPFQRRSTPMPRILVIHGAGMNMRGKVQTEIFGSNIEGEVVNKIYEANDRGVDAAIFNPAAFGTGYPALVAALSQVKFPTIEVHISNPIRRGPASQTAAVSQGVVAGFGIAGYALALRGLRDTLAAK